MSSFNKQKQLETRDENVTVGVDQTILDFQGDGVSVSSSGTKTTIVITGGGGGSGITTQEEGVTVGTGQSTINWIGPGTTVTSTGTVTTITSVAGDPLTTQEDGVDVGTFQDTLNFTTGLDVSSLGGTSTIKMSDTSVVPGAYGSSTYVPVVTVNQQGRITSLTTVAVSGGGGGGNGYFPGGWG